MCVCVHVSRSAAESSLPSGEGKERKMDGIKWSKRGRIYVLRCIRGK